MRTVYYIFQKCIQIQGQCLFAINGYNSTGYMTLVIAGVIFILLLLFAAYMEPFSSSPAVPIISVQDRNAKIRQVKETGIVNEVSVICCMSTMALYCLQSTNEAILTQGSKL